MEDSDVPLEDVSDRIQEHALHSQEKWIGRVALSSALLAVLAALAALLSGQHVNESMLERIKASDGWNFYQAKGIKSAILSSRIELLGVLGKKPTDADNAKVAQYKKDQTDIQDEVHKNEQLSDAHLQAHEIFARGVTFFQVAIAISAISILMRKKRFWFLSLGFGAVGLAFLVQGLLAHIPH